MKEVIIGSRKVGSGNPTYIIAEIGINHNGDIDIAKKLITLAAGAGCDAVKFQKRNPEICVPIDQRNLLRETPWGIITYFEYKKKLEFGFEEFIEIDRFCKEVNIPWFASPWDEDSVDFLGKFNTPCIKLPSAKLTDDDLLNYIRKQGLPIILSTGMSSLEQLDHAIDVLGKTDLIILHCCSAYPSRYIDLNLRLIPFLRERYDIPVGYSGHETGLPATVAAVALGACVVERHITLDRAMWGTDQAASLGPSGINKLVSEIRIVESAMGDTNKRILPSEEPIIKKLRNV